MARGPNNSYLVLDFLKTNISFIRSGLLLEYLESVAYVLKIAPRPVIKIGPVPLPNFKIRTSQIIKTGAALYTIYMLNDDYWGSFRFVLGLGWRLRIRVTVWIRLV
jgi:hypothetical protein